MTGENTIFILTQNTQKRQMTFKKNSRCYNRLFEGEDYSMISKGQFAFLFKQDQNTYSRNSFTQPHEGIRCLTYYVFYSTNVYSFKC